MTALNELESVLFLASLSFLFSYILIGKWLKWVMLIITLPFGVWLEGALRANPSTQLAVGTEAATIMLGAYVAVSLVLLATARKRTATKEQLKMAGKGLYAISQPSKKYDKMSRFFNEDKIALINSTVSDFLKEKKPFLKQKYSLRELAMDVNVPANYLSAFINRYHKMNYSDFINSYRVVHSKDMIAGGEWKQKTLEAIAFESGFNNRNTFTTAFKKEAGVSPVEYLHSIKKSNGEKITMSDITKPLSKVG